ncbi:hypothetical protein WME89_40980 [Sorangium sp. So ce321]|uniref:hypothetical protein n=1 Tax=Sorangium sp. So ce321 TaxID=3133300 RepID=UPI003F6096FE
MEYGLTAKASTIVLYSGLVMVLASACDLSYTCDTEEPGGAGDEIPTESVGAGDYPSNGADDEPENEEVGSAQLEMAGSCSPSKTCTDMFVDCQDKGGSCTRLVDRWGTTLCRACQEDCLAKIPYRYTDCYKCGFE